MSLILGPLGDRLGRRFLLQLTLLGTAVFSMLQYFINGFRSWLLIRMGAEGFTGSEWGAGATYLTETIGKRLRGLALSIMQSGWVFGYGLASVIAYFTLSHWGMSYGWRVAFLFAFLPAIVVLVIRSRLKETDRFEHLREIRDAKRRGDVAKVEELLKKYKVDVEASVRPSYRQLLGPDLRRVAIILAFYNFLTTGVAIVGDAMFPYYLSQVKGFNYLALISMFATLSFIGIVGYLANGLLNDRIGAKWPSGAVRGAPDARDIRARHPGQVPGLHSPVVLVLPLPVHAQRAVRGPHTPEYRGVPDEGQGGGSPVVRRLLEPGPVGMAAGVQLPDTSAGLQRRLDMGRDSPRARRNSAVRRPDEEHTSSARAGGNSNIN
jgi:Sugar phosphate permease